MIDYLFRFGADAYGQTILLGANWDLFWWFLAGAWPSDRPCRGYPVLQRRKAQLARASHRSPPMLNPRTIDAQFALAPSEPRVARHALAERLFH